ncbi:MULTISPECIES: tryptophan-rich sensory protein [unclassified Isoptericola]|uniref:tryptophan-rich sensory protein n=1 Tax=unclassified Isoptericola TaxID=2623355 RepID=UPI0027125329|nr:MULTISPECIES: tryptophan-rich sensory protein [unclassified Isoptericola]MDO8144081.1 tryptophan-rich sensory protein [Isoptericola sp. 178]MDO8149494.1 tryptophan-rich sensory protein [Isoptericola sp. b515]MDO8152657.1 tryptophan-rich sensory protein [Isoptericola sp. b408]
MTTLQDTPQRPATARDRVRQVVVAVGALLAILGAAVGSGAFGGQPIQEAADGALSADATVLAPDTPAFSIWSVIYTGLVLFAVVQALPGRAADPRLRSVAWWILVSMLLNAAWIGVVQAGWLWASVAVIAGLVAVLSLVLVRLVRTPAPRVLDAVVTDVTVGLYLGWVSVATLANTAAALKAADVGELGLGATGWGVALVAVGAVLALAVARYGAVRPAVVVPVGLAIGWGLAWIAVGRTTGPLTDQTVAVAAGVAAAVAVVGPVVVTLVRRRRARA